MAKKRHRKATRRRRRHVRGGRCGVERVRGHRRMVCRNKKGQITKSHKVGRKHRRKAGHRKARRHSGLHCPARFQGHKVHTKRVKGRGTRCYIKRKTGAWRWVKKVGRGRRSR